MLPSLPHHRRYLVAAIDEDGDVQAFGSDDLIAAQQVLAQMQAELTDARMIDAGAEPSNDR